MKKRCYCLLALLLCLVLPSMALAEGGDSAPATEEPQPVEAEEAPVLPESLTLEESKLTLTAGEKATISATIAPESVDDAKLSYKSANRKVAKVSSKGVITAVAAGKTQITVATVNGISQKLTITVKPRPKKVKLNKSGTVKLTAGHTLQLKATLSPKGARSGLTWKSKSKKVAKVSKKGLVTALKKGTTTITVATDNGKKASVKVQVLEPLTGEISGLLGRKLSSANARLANPLKPSEFADDIYQNRYFSVRVNSKKKIVSISLIGEAGSRRYRLFGVYPGMKEKTAIDRLEKAGMTIGMRTPWSVEFSSAKHPSRQGSIELTDSERVLAMFFAQD